jgi:hypothetical protein
MSAPALAPGPCPAWCIYGGRHPLDPDQDRPGWVRHEHPVRWLQLPTADGAMPTVWVLMVQVEHIADLDVPAVSRPVEILFGGGADMRLNGRQARQIAAALCDAADLWDAAQPEPVPKSDLGSVAGCRPVGLGAR